MKLKIKFKLQEVLDEKGKSKYWLSKKTGISENAIRKICENQSTQIKLETLEKICNTLQCRPFDIMDFELNGLDFEDEPDVF